MPQHIIYATPLACKPCISMALLQQHSPLAWQALQPLSSAVAATTVPHADSACGQHAMLMVLPMASRMSFWSVLGGFVPELIN